MYGANALAGVSVFFFKTYLPRDKETGLLSSRPYVQSLPCFCQHTCVGANFKFVYIPLYPFIKINTYDFPIPLPFPLES